MNPWQIAYPDTRFAVLAIDAPWLFGDRLPNDSLTTARGASDNYRCMTVEELKAMPLPEMLPDATLFMWRVSAMVEEAYAVVRAWGFTQKAELVWLKRTKTGKRHFGMGRTVRMEHESCIIATRGRPQTLSKSVRSTFEAQVGCHSEKPEEFYAIVEQLRAGPYCELFARRLRAGWTCLGNEISAPTCENQVHL